MNEFKLPLALAVLLYCISLSTSQNDTDTDGSLIPTKIQKTAWQTSQTFHRILIGMTDIDFKNKSGHLRNATKTLRKVSARLAGVLGFAGAVFSIILEFTDRYMEQEQKESPEMKFMKFEFDKLYQQLGSISRSIDDVKDLIKLETHKQAYLHDELKIINGNKTMTKCINEMKNATCTGHKDCRNKRLAIGEKYVDLLNLAENVQNILFGTLADGVFGTSLLTLLKNESRCNTEKINRFSKRVAALILTGQTVVLLHDLLTIKNYNFLLTINRTTEYLKELEKARREIENSCFRNINYTIHVDVELSQSMFTSNSTETNAIVLDTLDNKYPWIRWQIYTSKGDKGPLAFPKDSFRGSLVSTSKTNKMHVFAIPTTEGQVADFRGKVVELMHIIESITPDDYKNDIEKSAQTIQQKIKESSNLHGEVQAFAILQGSDFCVGYYRYDANNFATMQQYFFHSSRSEAYHHAIPNLNTIFHLHPMHHDKDFAFVVSFKLLKQKCTRFCYTGTCRFLNYSYEMDCECPDGFSGDRCQHSDNDIKHKLALLAVHNISFTLPSLQTVQDAVDQTKLLVAISVENIENAILRMESYIFDKVKELHYGFEGKLDWIIVLDRYTDSIDDLIYFQRMTNWTYIRDVDVSSKCTSRKNFAEKEEIARHLLSPFGIQAWLDDLNFLFKGRNEDVLDTHKPVWFLVMNKLKHRVCYPDYIARVDRTLRELTLLQNEGFVMWIKAYSFLYSGSYHIVERYVKVINDQNKFRKEATCSINIPNSNLQYCSGYIHPTQDVSILCDRGYYLTGKIFWVKLDWNGNFGVKKEEIWLSPMTKAPTPTEKSKKQRDNTKTPP